ncbi:carbohydrate binding domain-containing protein [Candidatus Woesearchaeota archaeon]|nr:carbohydrate binding domain-containing protein [Candidatus Woesearchaeota archaeon]
MKRAILLIFLMLVLMLRIVSADCSGDPAYGPILEGESIVLTSPGGPTTADFDWTITSPVYPYDDTDPLFQSAFSDQSGCDITFSAVKAGTYNIHINATDVDEDITVDVRDVLTEKGFGHQCFVVDTQSCANVYSYGEAAFVDSLSAQDVVSYGFLWAYDKIEIGNPITVTITSTLADLPATTVSGLLTADGLILTAGASISHSDPSSAVVIDNSLQVNGQILGGDDGILPIGSNVEIGDDDLIGPKDLTVYGSTTLHKIESLSNAGAPIDVNANLDVEGDVDVSGEICLGVDPVECRDQWEKRFEEVGIENLVRNPGFEYYDYAWVLDNADTGSGFSAVRTHTGQYSVKLVSKSPESLWWSDVVPISLYEDTEFTFSAWYYLESGEVDLFLLMYPSYDGSTYYPTGWSGSYVRGTTIGAWTRLNYTFTVPSATTYLVVRLDANYDENNVGTTTAYFDDVQLEKGGTVNRFRPRFLDFRGDAEFGDLDVMGELYTEGFLTAMSGASVIGDLVVAGRADVSGYIKAGDADVAGNVIATQTDSRLMGAVNLRKACDGSSPRMYQDGDDFVIELGQAGQCGDGDPCEDVDDCQANMVCDDLYDGTAYPFIQCIPTI